MRMGSSPLFVALAVGLLSGCQMHIPVAKPAPSGTAHVQRREPRATLKLVDARGAEAASFYIFTAAGRGRPPRPPEGFEPIEFLAENLQAEFAARGYPVTVTTDPQAAADMTLEIQRYRVVNRWIVTVVAAMEAAHEFRAELSSGGRVFPIRAFFYNNRVSVWAVAEGYEPCIHRPASILVKEIASKVNRALLGFRADDTAVDEILARARPKDAIDDGPYMEIIELGGTNNPRAMEALKKYAVHKDEFVRAVALDALGMLGPENELPFLKERYAALEGRDKYMALKAIGDAGDPSSLDFLVSQRAAPIYKAELAVRTLVELYVNRPR